MKLLSPLETYSTEIEVLIHKVIWTIMFTSALFMEDKIKTKQYCNKVNAQQKMNGWKYFVYIRAYFLAAKKMNQSYTNCLEEMTLYIVKREN